ncbi:DNA integrity scanning protein DisA [uncultured archaeon]|nr:DNA integrity scanning protein DisA [uncultured archaeon]
MEEKEKLMLEYLKKVSPGTSLRTVTNDLIRSELGALIVIEAPDIEKYIEGGFRVNCRFTPQRLFELCKMDGGIIISQDLRRILYANVLLTPDPTITTNETGTRHKAAERIAKQLNTFVIAVSERKKKTTLYYGNIKYTLRTSEEVSREITNTLTILEKQRELLDELVSKINILEISNLAAVGDVCKILQKTEIVLRNSEMLKKDFIELGKEGILMNLRYKELTKGVEKKQEDIIRDYSKTSLKKTKTLLGNLSYEGILELESIARLVFEKELEDSVSPRGFRFLSELNLSEKEVSNIVNITENLSEIINDDSNKLEQVLDAKTINIKEEIIKLKEKIIEGRVVV